jgi:hypothetical protein
MRRITFASALIALVFCAPRTSSAELIIGGSLNNGNLDRTYSQEITPGFFLPKPAVWQNLGIFFQISGGGYYENEMSSEPWAGPSPTPVTFDNLLNAPFPQGCGNTATDGDCGVFFKPFSASGVGEYAGGHLYQDNPATPGLTYTLTGWAGAEANARMEVAQFAIDFLNAAGGPITVTTLDLLPTLFVPNGQPFNYKQYSVSAVAPPGTVFVRARATMGGGTNNPLGGGQAFVVDDFTLTSAPEPTSIGLLAIAVASLALYRFRK